MLLGLLTAKYAPIVWTLLSTLVVAVSSLSTKCPGFRPIIVDEVLQCIIEKAVRRIARMNVEAVSESNLIYMCWFGGWD